MRFAIKATACTENTEEEKTEKTWLSIPAEVRTNPIYRSPKSAPYTGGGCGWRKNEINTILTYFNIKSRRRFFIKGLLL